MANILTRLKFALISCTGPRIIVPRDLITDAIKELEQSDTPLEPTEMIKKMGHDGLYTLHNDQTGQPVYANEVYLLNGDEWIIDGGSAPHKPASTGKVNCHKKGMNGNEFYPGVFDMKWVKDGSIESGT